MSLNTAKASWHSNPKQQYINGHFAYALKSGNVKKGLGVIKHISFFDHCFKNKHPETVTQKTDYPTNYKELSDSLSLTPVLSDFFEVYPNLKYKTFIADPAFDSYSNYSLPRNDFHFERVVIPINARNSKASSTSFDVKGAPVCPVDETPFKYLGKSGSKNRSIRLKWVCHKSVFRGSKRICTCENPCTDSSYGKCVYTYPDKDFRFCPSIQRNTKHWDNLYIHRVTVERTINPMKDSLALNSR